MKIIKFVLLVLWYLWALCGIIKNYSHYEIGDWTVILVILFLPNIIMWIIARIKKNNSDAHTLAVNKFTTDETNGSSDQYIKSDDTIYRIDRKPISDEELPHLIQIGYEKALQAEKESPNPKFHRTAHEENLSFNFGMKYGHEVNNLTEKFESLYRLAYETNDFDKKISLLNEAISAFENAKKFCYSKGKGGTLYFQDTWEYLHNSTNQCFSYLDGIQDALEDAIYMKDEVIPSIIDVITKNDGMLQRNIYKMLPDIEKSTIQRALKLLEANNSIIRNKIGNSYELHVPT